MRHLCILILAFAAATATAQTEDIYFWYAAPGAPDVGIQFSPEAACQAGLGDQYFGILLINGGTTAICDACTNPECTAGGSNPFGYHQHVRTCQQGQTVALNDQGVAECVDQPEEPDPPCTPAYIDPVTEQLSCGPAPCPEGQMVGVDFAGNETCVDFGQDCTANLKSGSFDYCQEAQDACEATGGTYGRAGAWGESRHVCLASDYGDQLPTCSSAGNVTMGAADGGGYYFACESATPPNNVCDSTLYDCDGDGRVDDQDGDGCVDNGIGNGACNGGGPDTYAGGNDPNAPNVGFDPFGDPATGATGICDPNDISYERCMYLKEQAEIAQNEDRNQALDQIATNTGAAAEDLEQIADAVRNDGGDYLDGEQPYEATGTQYLDDLATVPVLAAAANVATAFSGSGTCPTPTFDAFGTTFSLDYHCTLYASVSGILSTVMLVIWSIAGIRHVVSA